MILHNHIKIRSGQIVYMGYWFIVCCCCITCLLTPKILTFKNVYLYQNANELYCLFVILNKAMSIMITLHYYSITSDTHDLPGSWSCFWLGALKANWMCMARQMLLALIDMENNVFRCWVTILCPNTTSSTIVLSVGGLKAMPANDYLKAAGLVFWKKKSQSRLNELK